MTGKIIAQRDWNINPKTGARWSRNRKGKIVFSDVSLDVHGNITHHTPRSRYDCFGDPVWYYYGEFDTPTTYKGEPQPSGCGGCPSRVACAKIAYLRVEADPDLITKRSAWESATQRMGRHARYNHPTFLAFAEACDQKGWKSDNDDKLAALRKKDAKRQRTARQKENRRKARGRELTMEAVAEIRAERAERQALLEAAVIPGAAKWLRTLTPKTIALTCDVWEARELLEQRYGGDATGGDIARSLIETGRDHGHTEKALRTRVNEAVKRITRLESEPVGTPVWPDENRCLPRSRGHFLNGVVWQVLEEA